VTLAEDVHQHSSDLVEPRTVEALPAWARTLLAAARHGHLGLVDAEGGPRVLPVTFAVVGEEVVTAVDHKRKRVAGPELARVRWLRREPRAALTVDRYDDDWERLAWVQLLGEVAVHEDVDAAALRALQARYAPYRERPPEGPLLRLRVRRALCWTAAS
jgi:PPOX class probable F420-dependent enzyme